MFKTVTAIQRAQIVIECIRENNVTTFAKIEHKMHANIQII